ncbi:MAG TPA: hypothetical protein VFX31_13645, partial [Ktedonobacterales bacterium]|nr:hypothetical protein [Ktedonobacterales bacterium]
CARLAWSPGLSVITTTRLPAHQAWGAPVASWRVTAYVAPAVALRPTLGLLALETGSITFGPARSLGSVVTLASI